MICSTKYVGGVVSVENRITSVIWWIWIFNQIFAVGWCFLLILWDWKTCITITALVEYLNSVAPVPLMVIYLFIVRFPDISVKCVYKKMLAVPPVITVGLHGQQRIACCCGMYSWIIYTHCIWHRRAVFPHGSERYTIHYSMVCWFSTEADIMVIVDICFQEELLEMISVLRLC